MVNVHVIVGERGCVLVDAGLPTSAAKIAGTLPRFGLTPKDIKLIVITHAHVDHAGAAAELRERTGARMVAHAAERAHLTGQAPMTFCPTGWFGRLFVKTPLIHERYAPAEPDIVLAGDDTLDLEPFGVAGTVRHSGGHTTGSLSVQLPNGEALVGDLVASGVLLGGVMRLGHAIRPTVEADPARVGAELERLVAAGVQTFHLGHGGPLGAREVLRHARRLAQLQPGPALPQRSAA